MRLIPKRPITTFVEVIRASYEEGPWVLLDALSKTRARITNLKISVSDLFHSLLPSLATSLPDLEQLTLKCSHSGVPWLGASSPDHLSWHYPSGAAAVILPKLKWVTILVDEDRFKPTYMSSEWLRKKLFVPFCPALEVFECLCFPFCNLRCDFGLPSGLDRAWKTRRLPDGSWERQGPPPIPSLRRNCMQHRRIFHRPKARIYHMYVVEFYTFQVVRVAGGRTHMERYECECAWNVLQKVPVDPQGAR